jgi:hypothetical protein
MPYKRITKHHPSYKKIDKLMAFLEENQISISISRNQQGIVFNDLENESTISIRDNDSGEPIKTLPPFLEFKNIISDENGNLIDYGK